MKKGCLTRDKRFLSFITELIDFLRIILALYISFMAKIWRVFLNYTFHTFPKPPLPMG